MKNVVFIFLFIVLLISCESSVESENSVSASGVLSKIENSNWMYGTHTIGNSGDVNYYALRSNDYDLDDFNDDNVKIIGVKIEGYPVDGGPAYLDVKSIEVID